MSQEVFSKAEIFFQEKEEWYSFLNLIEYKDRIFGNWFLKCKAELNVRFQTNEIDFDNWLYLSWGNFSFKWYLKEFGPDSLCLFFENSTLHLWANGNIYNVEKVTELLQNNKYAPIIGAFERTDEICAPNSWYKAFERGNFRFNDEFDGYFDNARLAWFANYKTKELTDQIEIKVNKFRKNKEITQLLIELNRQTKK